MTKYIVERQYPLHIVVDIDMSQPDADPANVINVPPNAVLLRGSVNVLVAFNGTTPKLTAIDNSTSPISLFGNLDATAVAYTAALVAGAGHEYPAGAVVNLGVSGTPTAGRAVVDLEYVVIGRANEVYTVGAP